MLSMIYEAELKQTLDKAKYYVSEGKRLTTNIDFYLDDLQNFYQSKHQRKISSIVDNMKICTRTNNLNSDKYCTVLTKTIETYKSTASKSTESFQNMNTGGTAL